MQARKETEEKQEEEKQHLEELQRIAVYIILLDSVNSSCLLGSRETTSRSILWLTSSLLGAGVSWKEGSGSKFFY